MKKTIGLLVLVASTGVVFGQQPKKLNNTASNDPYVKSKGAPEVAEAKEEMPGQVGVLVEYIQLDDRMANKLVRKHASSISAVALREELESMIDEGTADLIDSSYLKTGSGQRAKVESIDERIYPTEYDPPEIPQTLTLTDSTEEGIAVGTAVGTAANATAFEMRPVGTSLEVDPVISPQGTLIEVNVAPELVRFLGRDYIVEDQDELTADDPRTLSSTIFQPRFYTMRQSTAVTVRNGDTILLAINRPDDAPDKMIMTLLKVDVVK